MKGQFIFPTCKRAGLNVSTIFKNTARDKSFDGGKLELMDMHISLKIYKEGDIIYEYEDFAVVKEDEFFELSEMNCPIIAECEGELLVIASCMRGENNEYFPQEHQLIFQSRNGITKNVSVLYDQLPISNTVARTNTILLLAPKVWISNEVNTFICFANSNSTDNSTKVKRNCIIHFLKQDGKILHTLEFNIYDNDTFILDIKNSLKGLIELNDRLQFVNVVARVNFVSCVIFTIIKNDKTGALAVEHSLSPHYYMNGDFSKVRSEAFLFSK